jgi:O-acetyl-ADP-ribose deacetylase (regulator of RNase III)
MPYTIIKGDLLEVTDVEYIVQQTCCTACRACGLSQAITTKWPSINPYGERRKWGRTNWAVQEDRAEPGTIAVYEFEEPQGNLKGVVCAFAQVCHGKPGVAKDPLGLAGADTAADRLRYFQSCLDCLEELGATSLAFPYGIGCGLAGGSWPKYEAMLRNWSAAHTTVEVRIVQLAKVGQN